MSPQDRARAHSFSVIHRRTVGLRDKKEVLWIGDRNIGTITSAQESSPSRKELAITGTRTVPVRPCDPCARVRAHVCIPCVPCVTRLRKVFFCLTGPYLTGRATIGRLELPPGEGRFVGPPLENYES